MTVHLFVQASIRGDLLIQGGSLYLWPTWMQDSPILAGR